MTTPGISTPVDKEQRRARVLALRQEGKSIRQIAEELGVSVGTVHLDLQATVDSQKVSLQALRERTLGSVHPRGTSPARVEEIPPADLLRRLVEYHTRAGVAPGYCYLLQAQIPGGNGRIKIGSSQRPLERLHYLQTLSPYEIRFLAAFPGGEPLERALHRHFKAARAHYEWFEPVPELLALAAMADPAALEQCAGGGR
jgi:hypothetical protein